jgi:hypothetical protein
MMLSFRTSASAVVRMPKWVSMKARIVLRTPRAAICFFKSALAWSGAELDELAQKTSNGYRPKKLDHTALRRLSYGAVRVLEARDKGWHEAFEWQRFGLVHLRRVSQASDQMFIIP